MRRFSLVPLLALIALPAAAAPDNTAAVKKELESNFGKMMAAFKKHDIEGVASFAADDYMGDDGMGNKMNKAKMKAMMKQYMDETKKVNSANYAITGLKVMGNKATGKSTFVLDANVVDAQGMLGGKKGASHHMVMTENTNMTWTKTAKGWKVKGESPAAPPRMIVDGKPFNPGPPPAPKKKGK
jgi:hypothetical protein